MNQKTEYGLITVLASASLLLLMFLLLGCSFTDTNIYNTYALQADRWRQGFLDLGQNYSWLELAQYQGKYYCSFPPFPSCVLFPLTFVFGSQTPDYCIMFLVDLIMTAYLYLIAVKLGMQEEDAMILTLLVTVGANTLYIMVKPYVWFFAQLICFTTATMAIYYALSGNGGLSLFCWGCSVGCRPMQVLFLPVLLVLLYRKERKNDESLPVRKLLARRWYWAVPVSVVAGFYMLLNGLRFGNILEFGHNYLPEFIEAEYGQFHIAYMKNNLLSLFRLPQVNENGAMIINHFGDLNFLLISPIILAVLIGWLWMILKKDGVLLGWGMLVFCLSAAYLLVITMHRTLGGWQFGNRYTIDILPYIFLLGAMVFSRHKKSVKYMLPLLIYGVGLNVFGTVIVLNGIR